MFVTVNIVLVCLNGFLVWSSQKAFPHLLTTRYPQCQFLQAQQSLNLYQKNKAQPHMAVWSSDAECETWWWEPWP